MSSTAHLSLCPSDAFAPLWQHPELRFITDPSHLASLSTDWRQRYHGNPYLAIEALSVEALAIVVAYCHDRRIPMVPQGGNTGLCGGSIPDTSHSQVILSTRQLNKILEVDKVNASLIVQAGCTLQQVHDAAQSVGFYFPVSLAAQGTCQIGGNLSTNAGGVHVIRYGMIRDWVLGLEVILPTGARWSSLKKLRKDNTGYPLKELFIGAEGTLGIITAASLKMIPTPTDSIGLWISLDSLHEVTHLLSLFREIAGDRLSAFEVMSKQSLEWVSDYQADWHLPAPLHAWTVWIELHETAPHSRLINWFDEHSAALTAWEERIVVMQTIQEQRKGWQWREGIPSAKKRAVCALNYDIAFPINALESAISDLHKQLSQHFPETQQTLFGHWGDGNIHFSVYVPRDYSMAYLRDREEKISSIIYDITHHYQGSISAEHGLGQLKAGLIQRYQSPVEHEMMQTLKKAFDPYHLMNPGKVVLQN